ncbi:GNAT family N-acetyltransferase [Fusibacter sp. JL298sf-3]
METSTTIVHYEAKYAKGVAQMWNESSAGWNGFDFSTTEEATRDKEEASTHLKLFIAVETATLDSESPRVLGYLKLSKYAFDEATLYVDLLNVHPDYHGARIGKKLVLEAVKATCELGYPRLDLFTWPGNTKAVPLYKKCGFFWEKTETANTHLMNFMPQVLAHPVVGSAFNTIDWYADSVREIVVEPDGRRKGDTDYYIYEWRKEQEYLKCYFEKTSRWLCGFKTDAYEIKLNHSENKRVFGRCYPFEIEFNNESGAPMAIELKGVGTEGVRTDLSFQKTLHTGEMVHGTFEVLPTDREQSDWHTHPAVVVEVTVEGETFLLKNGVKPMPPLLIKCETKRRVERAGVQSTLYVNLENNLAESADFEILLPVIDGVAFGTTKITASIEGLSSHCVQVPFTATKAFAGIVDMPIAVALNEGPLTYTSKVDLAINVYGSLAGGSIKARHYALADVYRLFIDEEFRLNEGYIKDLWTETLCEILPPKLGAPYTSEFEKKKADNVTFESNGAVVCRVRYSSETLKGAEFDRCMVLSPTGTLSIWHELVRFPEGVETLKLNLALAIDEEILYLPYGTGIMKLDEGVMDNRALAHVDFDALTEPWVFNETFDSTVALTWSSSQSVKFSDHCFNFESTFTRESAWQTPPVELHINRFRQCENVRQYLTSDRGALLATYDGTRLTVPPIVTESLDLTPVTVDQNARPPIVEVEGIDEQQVATLLPMTARVRLIEGSIKTEKRRLPLETLVFKTKGACTTVKAVEEGHEVYCVDNGYLKFKVAPAFTCGVFSLTADGVELFDHCFPATRTKSWYNPWAGGFYSYLIGTTNYQLFSETSTATFVTRKDHLGNQWTGVAVTTPYTVQQRLKGVKVVQYFLTMGDLPVLAHYSEVITDGGKYAEQRFMNQCFFREDSGDIVTECDHRTAHVLKEADGVDFVAQSKRIVLEIEALAVHYYSQNADLNYINRTGGLVFTEQISRIAIDPFRMFKSQVDFVVPLPFKVGTSAFSGLDAIRFE